MKINLKEKINKKDVILFICVFVFSMIANNAFLHRHYSSDAMCLLEHGYFIYPTKYFLLDGRIISTLVCYLGGVLNLPVDTYLFISNLIGILFLSIAIVILFKFIIKYLDVNNKWVKFMILLSVYTIIFNHMDIEYLLFPESCVMCAGLLFSIIAVKTYLSTGKGKKFESFMWLLLSSMCYQGLISIFPTLVITLVFLKIKENTKETLKYYIKETFKVGVMFVLALTICAGLIALFSHLLQASSYRLERISNILTVAKQIPYSTLYVLIGQVSRVPIYLAVIVMTITNILTIRYGKNKLFLKYILAMITAYMFSMGPILVFGYVHARMLMSIGAAMGISLLFISTILNDNSDNISKTDVKIVIMSICIIAYFIFNIINNYTNGYQHLKAFELDEQLGAKISKVVQNYEENSGIEVTKFSYCGDITVQGYENGIKQLGSLTERKFAMPHCIRESVNYYCNKKLQEVKFPAKIYYENFYGKEYTGFSEEQFLFIEDTLYMCVY